MPKSPTDQIKVTRPDKLLWPSRNITKRRYVDYLDAAADRMRPWVRERPLTLVRAPDGVGGRQYFQKASPTHPPGWIRTVRIPSTSTRPTGRSTPPSRLRSWCSRSWTISGWRPA